LIEQVSALEKLVKIIKLYVKGVILVNKLDEYYEKEYSKKVVAKQREEDRVKEEYLANQKKYIDAIPRLIEKVLETAEANRPDCERLMQCTIHKTPLTKGLFARPGSKYYKNDYYSEYISYYGWKIYNNIYLLTNGRVVNYGRWVNYGYDSSDVLLHEISGDVNLHEIDAVLLYENLLVLGCLFESN